MKIFTKALFFVMTTNFLIEGMANIMIFIHRLGFILTYLIVHLSQGK